MNQPDTESIEANLKRWSLALRLLSIIGIVWLVLTLVAEIVHRDGFVLAIPTESGIKVLSKADFSEPQRLSIVLLITLPSLCWLWMMGQLFLLSRRFTSGEVLSDGIVTCLRRFGAGLFAMGATELVLPPILDLTLKWMRKAEPTMKLWEAALSSGWVESVVAGVLVVIVAKIFQLGIRLKEDAELTV